MHKRRKGKAVAARAEQDSYYRPSVWAALLALALAFFLAWHGKAHAEDINPTTQDAAQLPDSVRGPGADRVPPGLACTDEIDFPPEAIQPPDFAVLSVRWRMGHGKALARPVADSGCPVLNTLDKV